MTLGSVLLVIALLLFTVAFIARPLVTGAGQRVTDSERQLSELLAARDHVLSSLSDLDMDNALEKIPAEDYAPQRAELLQEGAVILRAIDSMTDGGMADAGAALSDAQAPDAEAELEAAVARLRRSGDTPAGGYCPHCGKPVVADDRFCSYCGASLAAEEPQA
jgi:hypothetical protein